MIKLLCLLTLLTAGCASSSLSTPPKPTACNQADRHGVYEMSASVVSGDCPALPTTLVNFDDPKLAAGCVKSGTTWSDNDCKLSTSTTCAGDVNAAPSEGTGVTTQETQDGSILDGTFTLQIKDPKGPGCLGTYHVTYTRQ